MGANLDITLPPALYRGTVTFVQSPVCIRVLMDLRFGVHIERLITLEGIDLSSIPPALQEDAKYCLILLLAKRSILLHTDDSKRDDRLVSRVFVVENMEEPPIPRVCPYGLDTPLLEVSEFYRWLGERHFDPVPVAKLYGTNIPPRARRKG